VFQLNYFQTTLTEWIWFIGYLVASIPSAFLIERIGYQRALVTGLVVMTVGSLGMVLAASIPSYWVTVAAMFVVSSGIALLQVAANPYVAVIGPAETSESRLTLVQAFNTAGDVLAIIFGKYLILARTVGGTSGEGVQLSPRATNGGRASDRAPLSDRGRRPCCPGADDCCREVAGTWVKDTPHRGRAAPAFVALEAPQPGPRLRRHCRLRLGGDQRR
jgi:hypothetical protein